MDSIKKIKNTAYETLQESYVEIVILHYNLAFNFLGSNQPIISTLSNTRNYSTDIKNRVKLEY